MSTYIDATASITHPGSTPGGGGSPHDGEKLAPIRVKRRIEAVDAARGAAMILVCLSHIKQHFVVSAPDLYATLTTTTRVATPTFLLLSGFVIGHLLRGNARGRVALSLFDRGLFLMVIVHLTLGLADLPDVGFVQWMFSRTAITDIIGIALCIAVLIRGAPTAALLVGGASLYLLSWVISMTLAVHSEAAQLLASLFFDLRNAPNPLIDVALLPYLGVFLIGMGLSSYFREALANGESEVLARRLATIAIAAISIVLVGIISWHFGKGSLPESLREPHMITLLRSTLHPAIKTPPSPAYLLFYGGAGLLMTAAFFHNRPAWLLGTIAEKTAVIGKASLLCFVVQDWLFHLIPRLFGFAHLTSVGFWLVYFVAGVVLLFFMARQWNRIDGNRFFTIGLKRAARPAAVMKPSKVRTT